MQIAIYGGSFNPPHVGHTMVASWLLWCELVDEVWLTPTYAHAFDKDLLPFELRVRMCAAMAGDVGPRVKVCEVERELPVPSYTIQTLRLLRERHEGADFRLVVGADILPQTPQWRSWDAIEAEFSPIVVGRGGYPELPGSPTFPTLSSTNIRGRLRRGESVSALVNASVVPLLDGCWSDP